ncbi:MAG: class I SAM-dependent methyltransferase [Acidobacteriia bacterium]|nr:class I SAM-dependent methyltransferase [Terriglobia bacterium]
MAKGKLSPFWHAVAAYLQAWTRTPTLAGAVRMAAGWSSSATARPAVQSSVTGSPNPLQKYFEAHVEGRGIWKWNHYFEAYHRHLNKFVGREVHILEIGVYSGGSLEMWKQYFGPQCKIYGVDIEPACQAYADESVRIFIGDQADRDFWKRVKQEVPFLDIVIDDGGHKPHQQIVSLEEMLPHLRPGGVYICEDVQGSSQRFADYVSGLVHSLNATSISKRVGAELASAATPFQAAVHSIHSYPFLTVIEMTGAPVGEFVAPKHGTQWQPFL